MATAISGITSVTLYDTLGHDSIEYILNQTTMKTVVCSADKIKNITDLKAAGKLPSVTHIIYYDEAPASVTSAGAECGLTLVSYTEVAAQGKALEDNSATWE